jgi:hypothetical protein
MLEPKFQRFHEVINKKLFRVPAYQRGYSWTKRQRADLFVDLRKLKQLKRDEHFMATLVFRNTGETEEVGSDSFEILEIVDGQQRITTLIVLLKAIEKRLREAGSTTAEELADILVIDNGSLILLQTNHDAATTLDSYLRKGDIEDQAGEVITLHQKELIRAFRECEEFVVSWGDPIDLLRLIKNKVTFVFFVISEPAAVYTVFEVLNSRGLAVDWLDKMKSILMGVAFENKLPASQAEALEHTWSEIYRVLGRERVSDSDVLTFAATMRSSAPPGKGFQEQGAMEFFSEECRSKRMSPKSVSDMFFEIADELDRFLTDPRKKAISKIKQTRLLAAAILTSRLKQDPISFDQVLRTWERCMFRFYCLAGKDARDKVGGSVRLASQLHRNEYTTDRLLKQVEEITKLDFPEVLDRMREAPVYRDWSGRREALVYLFYKYEEHLAKEAGEQISEETWGKIWSSAPDKTIEHIYPQEAGEQWKGKLRQGVEAESVVHRLGNLLILPPGLNSKCGNSGFAEKKEIYRQTGLRHVLEVCDVTDWNVRAIENRGERLLEWIRQYWR